MATSAEDLTMPGVAREGLCARARNALARLWAWLGVVERPVTAEEYRLRKEVNHLTLEVERLREDLRREKLEVQGLQGVAQVKEREMQALAFALEAGVKREEARMGLEVKKLVLATEMTLKMQEGREE